MRLTKHHGLGNDFLVLLDRKGLHPVDALTARAICNRNLGVGADGLLHVTGAHAADASMRLFNADGSRAEISGNGLACVAQAVALAGWVTAPTVWVRTDVGVRTVSLEPSASQSVHRATVVMGPAAIEGEEPEWAEGEVLRAMRVSMGNPHLVLHVADPDAKVDLEDIGRTVNEHVPGGANVEVVWPGPGDGELTMHVYERGVGVTRACGTGACAVAAAARVWELAGERVRVNMPGGPAEITLGDAVLMTTAVVAVARIEYPWP